MLTTWISVKSLGIANPFDFHLFSLAWTSCQSALPLIYPLYAGLGSKVGFIFGTIAAHCFVFTYFCVPKCKGKTLEQFDYMFHERVPLRQFGSYQVPNFTQNEARKTRKSSKRRCRTSLFHQIQCAGQKISHPRCAIAGLRRCGVP